VDKFDGSHPSRNKKKMAHYLKIYFSYFFKKQSSHPSRNQKLAHHFKIMASHVNPLFHHILSEIKICLTIAQYEIIL